MSTAPDPHAFQAWRWSSGEEDTVLAVRADGSPVWASGRVTTTWPPPDADCIAGPGSPWAAPGIPDPYTPPAPRRMRVGAEPLTADSRVALVAGALMADDAGPWRILTDATPGEILEGERFERVDE